MDRSNIIYLLSETQNRDDYGITHKTYTRRMVFCNVRSVTRNEFFDGGRNGLNPEYQITMFFGDYQGEPAVEYNGQTYAVYRTYQATTDTLELYVQREGGTNGI